jgi:carboxyl-terminal processing protease
MGSKLKVAGWLALGAVAGALTTMQLQATARGTATQQGTATSFPEAQLPPEQAKLLRQLIDVHEIIQRSYVEPVDANKLLSNAISGMVSGLDPHSAYIEKVQLKEFAEGLTGRFGGVGINIEAEDGLIKVGTPIEGYPAFKAGLKSGDLIVRIDDTQVKGLTQEQAVRRIRGEPNTKVRLQVVRRSEGRTFEVELVRTIIQAASVANKMIEPGYAWVQVRQFQDTTVEDFVKQVSALYKDDPKLKGMVLDLRNDPGGALDASVALAAAFLPKGTVVVSTKGQLPGTGAVYKASPDNYLRPISYGLIPKYPPDPLERLPAALKNVPLVVLVNEGSASASEIVAGALQDHKRATVMGAQTFGKGSVQTLICLAGNFTLEKCPGAAMKITTQRYYTPKDRSIQAKGIVPDVLLDETAEGNVYAVLRQREADYEKHLSSGQGSEKKDPEKEKALEKARDEALKRLEEERAKNTRKALPAYGSPEDFQLIQALNQLKGKPVQASKTMTERKAKTDESAE